MTQLDPATPKIPASRIVVLMPNWLGDACMATPFLRALRTLYPNAHIAAVARPLAAPVLAGLAFINEFHALNRKKMKLTRQFLKENNFDLAILLPNSFRSAWLTFRAGIKNRLGYAREFRSLLLTHKLKPIKRARIQKKLDRKKAQAIFSLGGRHMKVGSRYQPLPTIEYYLKLAHFLGAPVDASTHMELAITDEERAQAESVLGVIENGKGEGAKIENLILMVPGANFGSSKCYPPEGFAQLAIKLTERPGAHVLLASSPKELPLIKGILREIEKRSPGKVAVQVHALAAFNGGKGVPLGALKELTRRASLMICNDTGPRHFAAAFNVPTVTLFGPTDTVWAETFSKNERQVRLPQSQIPCSPCQLKKCPIDHRCMRGLTPDRILSEVESLVPSLLKLPQAMNHESPTP